MAEIGRFAKALQENQDRNYKELQHRVHEEEAKRPSADHGTKAEVEDRSSRRNSNEYFQRIDNLGSQALQS